MPDARERRAEVGGLVGPDREQRERAGRRARDLGTDVRERVTRREVASEREGERDRRVYVRARQVPGRVDHHHDDQPEDHRDPDRPERSVVAGVGDDRAAAGEHQRERGEPLGARRGARVRASDPRLRLMPRRRVSRRTRRAARRGDLACHRLGVVGHALDRRGDVSLRAGLEQRECRSRVAILRLADRAAVDEQHAAVGVDPGLVGVAEDEHVTVGERRDPLERPLRLVLEQVLVDLARRAVHEPHPLARRARSAGRTAGRA